MLTTSTTTVPLRGHRNPYRPKTWPGLAIPLTPAADAALQAACARLWGRRQGRRMASTLVEHLLRTRLVRVRRGAPVARSTRTTSVSLTQRAKDLLAAATRTTDRSRGAVVSELLERFAAEVAPAEFPHGNGDGQ